MQQNQAQPVSHNQPEYSVSEISLAVKKTIESSFSHVRVRGEISGYRGPHSSGHCYFSLKDEKAKIDTIIWKGQFSRMKFRPEEGMEVIATGQLSTFPGKSNYQLIIEAMEPAGIGALMALLEKRKAALTAEGLFDAARKRPLPLLPGRIGVVTSPTGAVIRDIIHRISDRHGCHVLLWPVRVQGEGAAAEITCAIMGFNALPAALRPDVLIVARGGGALEDLWCFNEESVVRAAAASLIPLISAVGHETDTTLIDFAADCRAPTPTAAAEMATPVRTEWLASLSDTGARLARHMRRLHEHLQQRVTLAEKQLPRPMQLLSQKQQLLDGWEDRLNQSLPGLLHHKTSQLYATAQQHRPTLLRERLIHLQERIIQLNGRSRQTINHLLSSWTQRAEMLSCLFDSLNIHAVLARGYAIVRNSEGHVITSHAALQCCTQGFAVHLHDGITQAQLSATHPPTKRHKPRRPDETTQETLL